MTQPAPSPRKDPYETAIQTAQQFVNAGALALSALKYLQDKRAQQWLEKMLNNLPSQQHEHIKESHAQSIAEQYQISIEFARQLINSTHKKPETDNTNKKPEAFQNLTQHLKEAPASPTLPTRTATASTPIDTIKTKTRNGELQTLQATLASLATQEEHALNILKYALQHSGYTHVKGHLQVSRAAEISNAQSVNIAVRRMEELNNSHNHNLPNMLSEKIKKWQDANYTPQMLAHQLGSLGIESNQITNHRQWNPTLQRAALFLLEQSKPIQHASNLEIEEAQQKLKRVLQSNITLQEIRQKISQSFGNDMVEGLNLIHNFKTKEIIAERPTQNTIQVITRFLLKEYGNLIKTSERFKTVGAEVMRLMKEEHITRQGLLTQIQLLAPDMPNSALAPAYGDPVNEKAGQWLDIIEETLRLLTPNDLKQMRENTYEQLAESTNPNPILLSLSQQLQQNSLKLKEGQIQQIADNAHVSLHRLQSLLTLTLDPAPTIQLPLNLKQIRHCLEQSQLLLGDQEQQEKIREARRQTLQILKGSGTPETQMAILIRNFRLHKTLSTEDLQDILGSDEKTVRQIVGKMPTIHETAEGWRQSS